MRHKKYKLLTMKPIRVYVDTSVFGGCFEQEFQNASKSFFDRASDGHFKICFSPLVVQEIEKAPQYVRSLFNEVEGKSEMLQIDGESVDLMNAYLKAGIVATQYAPDALHVAVASRAKCVMIVSWNFKHIVSYRKIPLYNEVNEREGYGEIGIFSPLEVVEDEEEV